MHLADQFFFSLAKLYRRQEYRLKHLDNLAPPIFPWMKSAKDEALDIGEVKPDKVLGWFQEWKEDQLKRANSFQENEKAKGSTWDGAQRWVTAAENVTLEDVYLYGSFYVEQMRLGHPDYPTDKYSEKFPEVVDLIKKALEAQPKKLSSSPPFSSATPPDIITLDPLKK